MQPHTIPWDTKSWRYFAFVQLGFGPEFSGWLMFQKQFSHLMYEIHIWIWWLPECSKNLFVPTKWAHEWWCWADVCKFLHWFFFFFHSVTWTLNKVTPESDYTLKVQEFYLQRLFDWAKKQIVKQIRWHWNYILAWLSLLPSSPMH